MKAQEYLRRVRLCKCVVCMKMGLVQATPTTAHHPESVRDSLSDFAAVALCHEHHQGGTGVHTLSRRVFETRYQMSDLDMVAATIRQVMEVCFA